MKFLVIGLGSIGMRHAKNIVALGHEVTGYDIDGAKVAAADIPFVIDDADTDAIVICTPTLNHYADLVDAIHDEKHILVEKPIAHRSNDIPGLLNAAKHKNLIVMVGNMLRFHPNVMMAKSLIKNPKSAVFQVLQKNDKPAYRRDGVLLNWGAHEIDLALYLFGSAEVIDADVTEESAVVSLTHSSGATSTIVMDYLMEPEVRQFEIEEEDQTHKVDLTLHDWNSIYLEEMKAFIGLIEGKHDPRCATGEDGLATLKIIEQAQAMS